jgi:hypothetical protein
MAAIPAEHCFKKTSEEWLTGKGKTGSTDRNGKSKGPDI